MNQLLNHVRSNAVAYTALFFAVGGGGGSFAVAATQKPTATTVVHGCEYKKNGELLLKNKCNRVERPVVWSQAPNTAHGTVHNGTAAPGVGFTARVLNGNQVQITLTACPAGDQGAALVASPLGPNTVSVTHSANQPTVFIVSTDPTKLATNEFIVLGEC
ncbi:MAG: hypothetical protein J2O48_05790 [Solirubrobacterales bacterium]|nr:hypothetical protein [Solirubrobacterales bacterium]